MWTKRSDGNYVNISTGMAITIGEVADGTWSVFLGSSSVTLGAEYATEADAQTAVVTLLSPAGIVSL